MDGTCGELLQEAQALDMSVRTIYRKEASAETLEPTAPSPYV